jgi:hypothetical protein
MEPGRLRSLAPPPQESSVSPSAGTDTVPRYLRGWWLVGIAGAIYLAHALLFGTWLIDDAGISFAYARNLAHGYGLVSQPGMPPVEGFSNPLWVFILALLFRLGLFHSTLTPKLLSLVLVLGSFAFLNRGLRRLAAKSLISLGVVLLLSFNTAFVVWTSSGLENPLYVFLASVLFALIARERIAAEPSLRFPLGAGLLATALALTRPDALLCAALYPLLTAVPRAGAASDERWRGLSRRWAVYSASFFGTAAACELGRWLYFHQLLPNTYYAKGGLPSGGVFNVLALQLSGVVKILKLFGAVADGASGILMLALVVGTVYGAARGWLSFQHGCLAAFAAVTGLGYLLLPVDWMPGFRFATAVLPFLYGYSLCLGATLGRRWVPARSRRTFSALAIGAACGASLALYIGPSMAFAMKPTVPFSQVAVDFGLSFNRYANLLHVRDGSLLLPDLGGTLYTSELKVYDLAGLCDRTIGRTLRHDQRRFYDYVFDDLKPTFIHTHHYWTAVSFLEGDPRFRRDYVPLVEYVEPQVSSAVGLPLRSGDFVRRAVADAAPPRVLAQIRDELARRYRREILASNSSNAPQLTEEGPPAPARAVPGGPMGPD